jgi:hypothetical protein
VRRISINTPLVLSLAFVALAAIALLVQVPPLLGALVTPRPGADPTQARLGEFLTGHEQDLVVYRDRFNGRSMFFMPSPPRRTRVTLPPPVDDDGGEPAPPPPRPTVYEGPSVLFVVGDEVWFHDGVRVRVGEEGSNGVTVISSSPPWEVKLGHRGGEFPVVLFERAQPGLDEKPRGPQLTPGLVQVKNDDQTVKAEDQMAKAEDQTVKADERTVKADDQKVKDDDRTVKAKDQMVKDSDETEEPAGDGTGPQAP